MDEVQALVRVVLAAAAGGIIGLEREVAHKPAGVRTFSMVALGACAFVIIGLMAFGDGDPASRVASTIITGIGFLGAGAIIQRGAGVVGLTTAAGVWGAAAVGMAFGAGLFILASGATVIMLVVLRVVGLIWVAEPGGDPDRDGRRPAMAMKGRKPRRDALVSPGALASTKRGDSLTDMEHTKEISTMEDRLREAKGEVKKGVGSLTGNKEMEYEGEAEAEAAKFERETEGAVDKGTGKVEETIGDLTGDTETEYKGKGRQVEGDIKRAG
jgi:uncharacterized membrane protein YhiD involved in acid resistance